MLTFLTNTCWQEPISLLGLVLGDHAALSGRRYCWKLGKRKLEHWKLGKKINKVTIWKVEVKNEKIMKEKKWGTLNQRSPKGTWLSWTHCLKRTLKRQSWSCLQVCQAAPPIIFWYHIISCHYHVLGSYWSCLLICQATPPMTRFIMRLGVILKVEQNWKWSNGASSFRNLQYRYCQQNNLK